MMWEQGIFSGDGEGGSSSVGPHASCAIEWLGLLCHNQENYFFRLSKYQKEIEEVVINNEKFVLPVSRKNEVAGWVKDGLRDFSISRVNMDWGVQICKDPKHTVYVWFDALTGNLSGLFPPGEPSSLDKVCEMGWPANVHVIGKDILCFHAVYWPAMLLSAGLRRGGTRRQLGKKN